MSNLVTIANQFNLWGKVVGIQELGNGNINHTFLVTLDCQAEKHCVLQRINTQVFRQPQLVMQNMRTFSEHVRQRLAHTPLEGRWEVPRVLLTRDGQDHWVDSQGSFWRVISFIESAHSFDTITNCAQAREVGYGLGMFHRFITDLPTEKLADTLEGYHITPHYLQQYEAVVTKTGMGCSPEVQYCANFIRDRHAWADVLEIAKAQGKLPLRPIHGDPKVNNIMVDQVTGQAIGLVDLDTVKPGLVHYDIGDCLRSCCNCLGEETEDWESVCFDLDLCQAILHGYCSVASTFLTANDYDYLYDAIRLLAFELGLRFFTDYLAGNVYFKVKHPDHNLARAIVQFKLVESIEDQEAAIRSLIQDLR